MLHNEVERDGDSKKSQPALHSSQPLFKEEPLKFDLPELYDLPLDDLYDEMEILGFTLSNPFELADDEPSKYIYAKDLDTNCGKFVSFLFLFFAFRERN